MDDLVRSVLELVRRRLPPESGAALDDPAADLPALGLGSLAVVGLVVDLERELSIAFPADLLRPDIFHTANSIAAAISSLSMPASGQ